MSDITYVLANPEQTDGVTGDLSTPTPWDVSFEATRLANYNSTLAKVAADMTLVMSLLGVTSADTLTYSWASNDAIIVAPGLAIASDGTTHTVASATTLTLDANLDTGTRAAATIYFVWIGTDSVRGLTKLVISTNYDTAPTNLASAYRLRHFFNTNSDNSNIEQFDTALPDDWPYGKLYSWEGAYKPAGTFWAHGQALSRTHGASARIFARLGTTWGVGDGSTTFNLPDTRGRSPMGSGQGSGLTARTLGAALGEEKHLQTINEMPAHTHNIPMTGAGGGTYIYYYPSMTDGFQRFILSQSTGNGQPFNVIQPVFVGGFIIKG